MKKTRFIKLVLIGFAFAGCDGPEEKQTADRLFIRSDTSAKYKAMPSVFYYRFITGGRYVNGSYQRGRYVSNTLEPHMSVRRGGFGRGFSSRG